MHRRREALYGETVAITLTHIETDSSAFYLSWPGELAAEYPYIWLRDNDPADLHPTTQERLFDLTSVELDIQPLFWRLSDSALELQWPDQPSVSHYPLAWLEAHRPGRSQHDPAHQQQHYWDANSFVELPRFDVQHCQLNPLTMLEALQEAKRVGLIVFSGLDDEKTAGERFGDLIGFKRQTNFGTMFEVISKPTPNNLAYTSLALPLHTDLPNQEHIPGYQLLHCYRNDAQGGASHFADGFNICETLREQAPEAFSLLSEVAIPWRFHDEAEDIRYRRPIIETDQQQRLTGLAFNAHIADVPDMDGPTLYDFYAAYRQLMLRIRDPRYRIEHRMRPGEMVMFDNRRILHGREAFSASGSERDLRGYYIEHNEVDSRMRVLARQSH